MGLILLAVFFSISISFCHYAASCCVRSCHDADSRCGLAVDKLLSLETRGDANYTFTRQRMHDLANDDIVYELSVVIPPPYSSMGGYLV